MVIAYLPFQLGRPFGLLSVVADLPTPSVRQRKGSVRSLCGRRAVVPSVGTDPIHPGGTREVRQGKLDEAGKGETQGPVHMKPQDGVLEYPDP